MYYGLLSHFILKYLCYILKFLLLYFIYPFLYLYIKKLFESKIKIIKKTVILWVYQID